MSIEQTSAEARRKDVVRRKYRKDVGKWKYREDNCKKIKMTNYNTYNAIFPKVCASRKKTEIKTVNKRVPLDYNALKGIISILTSYING